MYAEAVEAVRLPPVAPAPARLRSRAAAPKWRVTWSCEKCWKSPPARRSKKDSDFIGILIVAYHNPINNWVVFFSHIFFGIYIYINIYQNHLLYHDCPFEIKVDNVLRVVVH